jgi:hypothetical protein
MMYKIKPNEDVVVTNPELASIPEFADLADKKLRYVIFLTDYQSPLRNFPEPEKKRLAAIQAGFAPQDTHQKTLQPKVREMINGSHEDVNKAIAKYKELQYNEDRELMKTLQKQMNNIKKMVDAGSDDPGEMKKINDLLLTLADLREQQRKIAITAGLEETLPELEKEDKPMRTIDKVMNEQMNED